MAKRPSADDNGPGFSSRKMNELIALSRALGHTANQQVELLRRLERAVEERSTELREMNTSDSQPMARPSTAARPWVTWLSIAASVATVAALVYAAISLQVSTDAAQRASISQSFSSYLRYCASYNAAGKEFLEGGEVFTVMTNTGRLPITVLGLSTPKGVAPSTRDFQFRGKYLDVDGKTFQNRPFVLDVGQAVALSVKYSPAWVKRSKDSTTLKAAESTYVDARLSDGRTVVPSVKHYYVNAPSLVRTDFRGLTQLKCEASEHEMPTTRSQSLLFPNWVPSARPVEPTARPTPVPTADN